MQTRTEQESKLIRKQLIEKIDILSKFNKHFHKLIAQSFEMKKTQKGMLLYEQNQLADGFYVILKGKVALFRIEHELEIDSGKSKRESNKMAQRQFKSFKCFQVEDQIYKIEQKVKKKLECAQILGVQENIGTYEFFKDI